MTEIAVLVIDDEPRLRNGVAKLLASQGYRVHVAGDGATGLQRLRDERIHVVVSDLRMPGLDGLELLRQIKDAGLDAEVILLTGHGSIDVAVAAMKQGAYDFLTKPPDSDHLLQVVERAAERHRMVRRTRALEAAHAEATGRPLIATSPAMRRVLAMVEQIARSDATVLIHGESGTGKELIARAIHAHSARRDHPLVAVNCAALPDTLVESELFGHEKGAFTGAMTRKPGKFELADGGTLLLDEVGELAPIAQSKLLRVLQEREVERLGGTRPVPVEVQVLAATNQHLRKLVGERRFREDLYYRLNVVSIELPPLRERAEDLAPLAEHFLSIHARRLGKPVRAFSPEALALLCRYPWPGNVRELEHAVQRAVILSTAAEIAAADLGLPADVAVSAALPFGPAATLADVERQWIMATVDRCGGNQSAAAAVLGIDRTTLHRKLKQYGE